MNGRDRFLRAINMVQKGLLGAIKKITAGIGGSDVGGPFKKERPPMELDWNFWLGQVPLVDYIKERCHNQFRWGYENSGGMFTDWGAHHVDIATWAIEQNIQGLGTVEIEVSDAKHPVPFKDGYPTHRITGFVGYVGNRPSLCDNWHCRNRDPFCGKDFLRACASLAMALGHLWPRSIQPWPT